MANGEPSPIACRRLERQIAVVTGGASGIGRAACSRLSSEGASIAIFDIDETGSNETIERSLTDRGLGKFYRVDVTRRESVAEGVKAVIADFGRIDILVNNVGLARRSSFLDLNDKDWRETLDINLTAPFLVGQAVAREMVKHRVGKIVNVASLAAHYAPDRQAVYAAAKGGVVALTNVMAFELAPLGINVNGISPGPVETEMSARNMTVASRRARELRIPKGRLAKVEEIAAAISFLVSPDAEYVNGTTLIVDGGLLTAGIRE